MKYTLLALAFFSSIGVCFLMGLRELLRPTDAGPLKIDRKRDVDDRFFGHALRSRAEADGPGGVGATQLFVSDRLRIPAHGVEMGEIVVSGDAYLPPGARVGALAVEDRCILEKDSEVVRHVDAVGRLELRAGARVGGRATSSEEVVLHPGSSLNFAAAAHVASIGGHPRDRTPPTQRVVFDKDHMLAISFEQAMPLDAIVGMARLDGSDLPGSGLLLRAEELGLISGFPLKLEPGMLTWFEEGEAYYLGCATIRMLGNVTLPPDALVPGSAIVDGDLLLVSDCEVHGSLNVRGNATIGPGCTIAGSISVTGDLRLSPDVLVLGPVSAIGAIDVDSGCSIGSPGAGGMVSREDILIGPGVRIAEKVYAEGGVRCKAVEEPA